MQRKIKLEISYLKPWETGFISKIPEAIMDLNEGHTKGEMKN